MLYVFDPTALHHVILKDQYVFEEAAWFLKSVGPTDSRFTMLTI